MPKGSTGALKTEDTKGFVHRLNKLHLPPSDVLRSKPLNQSRRISSSGLGFQVIAYNPPGSIQCFSMLLFSCAHRCLLSVPVSFFSYQVKFFFFSLTLNNDSQANQRISALVLLVLLWPFREFGMLLFHSCHVELVYKKLFSRAGSYQHYPKQFPRTCIRYSLHI